MSTMPVWHDGRLVPRPFILRLFLARVGDGWRVMPGGFVRVADDVDARAVNLQQGGRTADAWVLSDKPVARDSRCCRRPTASRSTARPARCRAAPPPTCSGSAAMSSAPRRRCAWCARCSTARPRATKPRSTFMRRICALLARLGRGAGRHARTPRRRWSHRAALQRRDLTGALPYLGGAAQPAASVIRDRFSPDAWRALTDLVELINAPLEQGPTESAMFERVNGALRIIASFSGLAQENMSQLAGWRFLELGRRIERALATCRFVRQFAFATDLDGALDVLLELADSQITYRLRYVMVAARAPVIDLVALDPNNPRSVVYPARRASRRIWRRCRSAARRTGCRRPSRSRPRSPTRMRTADAATDRCRMRCSRSKPR